jgi:hypothetical protein
MFNRVCLCFCIINVCQQLLYCLMQLVLQLPEATLPHICRMAAVHVEMDADEWGCAALQMAWRCVLPLCVWQRGSLPNHVPVLPALKCTLCQAECGPATDFVLACCFVAQEGALHSLQGKDAYVVVLCFLLAMGKCCFCLQRASAECRMTL